MNYLLDTNMLVVYGRATAIADKIEAEYHFFSGNHNLAISVVSLGELDSLAKQFNYGAKRKARLNKFVEAVFKIDINIQKIIECYGDIDAFSQGKLSANPLATSARNMGKNDLWIAATASVYNLELITTDKDFEHLHPTYLSLQHIDITKYK